MIAIAIAIVMGLLVGFWFGMLVAHSRQVIAGVEDILSED